MHDDLVPGIIQLFLVVVIIVAVVARSATALDASRLI